MIDIISVGEDMGFYDTQTVRAQNILSIQLQTLIYAPDFGIDLKYFLSEEFRFQDESFQSYLIQRLANYSINVSSLAVDPDFLSVAYQFNLTPAESTDSLVSR